MAARPTNYLSLLEQYPNLLIGEKQPVKGSSIKSPLCRLISFFSGEKPETNNFSDTNALNDLKDSNTIKNVFNYAIKNKSAVHLIGNISSQKGRYGNIDSIQNLLEIAGTYKLLRIYLHLVLDSSSANSFSEIKKSLTSVEALLRSLGIGEIASICGINAINNSKTKNLFLRLKKQKAENFIEILTLSTHSQYLNINQALEQYKRHGREFSDIPPTSLKVADKFNNENAKIEDFDSIIFFNHNNNCLESLAATLDRHSFAGENVGWPKFIKIAAMYEPLSNISTNVEPIFENKPLQRSVFKQVSFNGGKCEYITDSTNISFTKKLFDRADKTGVNIYPVLNRDEYVKNYSEIISKLFLGFENKLADDNQLIVLELPTLYQLAENSNFKAITEAVTIIDRHIGKIVTKCNELDIQLIITSAFGRVEKLSNLTANEKVDGFSASQLPFLLISKKCKREKSLNSSFTKTSIYDILKPTNDIYDIAPTLLDIVGLSAPDYMIGNSFLNQLSHEK